jgi:hypothetical protein
LARQKAPKQEDPNKLKRERAGRYVTPDGRFAVEGGGGSSWYVVDAERENELGLPLMEGPFATLDEARDRVVAARAGGTESPAGLPRPIVVEVAEPAAEHTPAAHAPEPAAEHTPAAHAPDRSGSDRPTTVPPTTHEQPASAAPAPKQTTTRRATPRGTPDPIQAPPPVPDAEPAEPAWLERRTPAEQAQAHRLLAVLERLGIDDPALVRRDIEANVPEVAAALLARRVQREAIAIWREPESVARELASLRSAVKRHLRPLVEPQLEAADRVAKGTASPDDLAAFAWLVAIRTAGAFFDAIDGEGDERRLAGEPGWRLLELDGRREPTGRAITLDVSDVLGAKEG